MFGRKFYLLGVLIMLVMGFTACLGSIAYTTRDTTSLKGPVMIVGQETFEPADSLTEARVAEAKLFRTLGLMEERRLKGDNRKWDVLVEILYSEDVPEARVKQARNLAANLIMWMPTKRMHFVYKRCYAEGCLKATYSLVRPGE